MANSSVGRKKNLGIDLGLGFQSNYGLIGAGGRYFLSKNQDVHITSGLDLSGLIGGAGSRYYFHSPYDKCFFIFKCKQKYFIGGTVIFSNHSTVIVKKDGMEGEYKQSDGYAGNITFGSYDIFGDSFTIGLEIGYRMWMKRPDVTFQEGAFSRDHKESLEKILENSLNVAFTLGWVF